MNEEKQNQQGLGFLGWVGVVFVVFLIVTGSKSCGSHEKSKYDVYTDKEQMEHILKSKPSSNP
ncbi:hypothetical protein ABE137_11990 [Brevibacillus laterosporus]|uniref:hypothetical protein n=1 Tax=Brevibacillus phage Sundance TaxID=1691958 RepID=UPI0006BCE120|nr:hypothetical protein [Brevibacillus laterosporus]YP_009194114.1 hypothetical protein AVT09_gp064 [Brevibacillus phage Sundance]ALA47880.1 hypothetical protein SUNDANCE_64 [Brevibacillus phage Sundance]MCR8994683.1 hypothetical protein [Brevibacillus laterosporus]